MTGMRFLTQTLTQTTKWDSGNNGHSRLSDLLILSKSRHKRARKHWAARFWRLIKSSHAGGHWFESSSLHQTLETLRVSRVFPFFWKTSDLLFFRRNSDDSGGRFHGKLRWFTNEDMPLLNLKLLFERFGGVFPAPFLPFLKLCLTFHSYL